MARVLVVDDNDEERELYARMLYYNGFDVLVAPDPASGLAIAHDERPDLILMDYRMPQMDGLTATQILHSAPETASIPVVCVTGHNIAEDNVLAAGCEAVIRKPTPIHELVRRIRDYVDGMEDQFVGDVPVEYQP